MKKNFIYALMSAIAFTGAVPFSACSSSDDVIDNPDYNPETNTVKTQFAISIPNNAAGETRMSESIVQGQTSLTFRGIHDVVLIPFATTVTSTSTLLGDVISLEDISNSLGANNSKVYSNVALKVGTGAFLFYGEATPEYANPENITPTEKFKYGSVSRPSSLAVQPGSFLFSLEKIHNSATADSKATNICTYISAITAVDASGDYTLHNYLEDFKTLKGGSSATVLEAVQRLRNKVVAVTTTDDAISTIKNNILSKIDDVTYVTKTDNTLAFKDVCAGYPANINLPEGAASITWSGNTASPALGLNASGTTAPLTSYAYPPSLYYRANSLIRVAASEQSSSYSTKSSWSAVTSDLYTAGTVDGSTRSVALVDQVQYAVGRMDLTVKAAAATLYDRDGIEVTVADAGFPVSAVLIGGQKNVDFGFQPSGSSVFTIYDKDVTGVAAKNDNAVGKNYTLVFETDLDNIQIAIELTNNTNKDFKGKDGVIPKGGKFYLVGTLTVANGTQPTGGSITKVFLQDYITEVNLTIQSNANDATTNPNNDKGLGDAYNVLPDLQTPQMELGLSVNLSWEPGLKFNVDL